MGRGRSLLLGELRQLQVAPRRLLDTFGVAGLHRSRFFGYGEQHGAACPPPRSLTLPPDQLSFRKRAGTQEKPATRRFRRARTETVVIACECFVAFLSCMSLNTRNHVGAGAPVTVVKALILCSSQRSRPPPPLLRVRCATFASRWYSTSQWGRTPPFSAATRASARRTVLPRVLHETCGGEARERHRDYLRADGGARGHPGPQSPRVTPCHCVVQSYAPLGGGVPSEHGGRGARHTP